MLPSIAVQRKYLILLNKHFKTVLKASQLPPPSKMTPAQVPLYFNLHFVPKENYYVPKITMDLTPSDDEFMKLAPKEPKPKAVKVEKAQKAAAPMDVADKMAKVRAAKKTKAPTAAPKAPKAAAKAPKAAEKAPKAAAKAPKASKKAKASVAAVAAESAPMMM
jgi:hypothetical protein